MNVATIVRFEAMRWARHPVHRWVIVSLTLLLAASAVWSGLDARALPAEIARGEAQWQAERERAMSAAPADVAGSPAEGARAAQAAHALGRGELGATRLPAGEGLVLGVQSYRALPTALRVSVDGRHADGRATGTLTNPLLADTGMPGLASVIVLLVPLAALALTAGVVQEDRELGVWRFVCAQCRVGVGMVFGVALGLRAALLFGVAALCCALAFALDPLAAWAPLAWWLLALAVFVLFWVIVGAALTGALGLWLASSFAVPAALGWAAARSAPMPSRLAAIVELRAVQQRTEDDETALLRDWYAAHPDHRPAPGFAPARPTWPVTFMPRYAAQETALRPRMRAFDAARAAQAEFVERRAWMSPALAMTLLADRLAGVEAAAYARYVDAVDDFDDRWRAFFVPAIMSYRGLTASELRRMPVFRMPAIAEGGAFASGAVAGGLRADGVRPGPSNGTAGLVIGLFVACGVVLIGVGALRGRLHLP